MTMADLVWKKNQKASIIQSGSLSSGTIVTVKKDYSESDSRNNYSVVCDYKGSEYSVTASHLGKVWVEGEKAKIIKSGGLSSGTIVTIKRTYTAEQIRKSPEGSVDCSYSGADYQVTQSHLGAV